MRKLLVLSALLAWGCSDSTPSAVPTTVSVTGGAGALDAIGATQVVRAAVRDQNGDPMPRAELSWSSSTGAVSVASAGGDSAIVTARANGPATVTATAGSASGSVDVQVAQAASSFEKAGDGQSGAAGAVLAAPVRLEVRDRRGQPAVGITVSFEVVLGGGSISAASVVTGADGAAGVLWTLGTTAGGLQQVTATVPGAGSASFSAMATAAAPAVATATAGDQQVAARGAPVAVAPRVRVVDAFGNPVEGMAVTFSVTEGGGSVSEGERTTDAQGSAAVGAWTLGPADGPNTLTATFPGTALPPIVFTATGAGAGTLAASAGANQAAMAGTAVPTAPAVVLRDGAGAPLAGVTVTFAVTSGGGTVSGASAVTDAAGVARVGGWVLGAVATPNTLTATAEGIASDPVVFRAAGCSGGGGTGYALTLCFTSPVTSSQRAAYEDAAVRWSEVIRGDLAPIAAAIPAGSCGSGSPALDLTIDDLLIFAGIVDIDGPGAVLGQAGWCYRRAGGLPVIGLMRFDAADAASLEARGNFVDVVLHEMGHVLGLSAGLWQSLGLLQDRSSAGSTLDTYFSGSGAIAGFDAIGGTTYTGGMKVPVENGGGAGTMNSHWRESVLANELMTGYLNAGVNALSLVTVRALADMGYVVDLAAADPFSLTLSVRRGEEAVIELHDDEYRGPRWEIERDGRRRRVQ